MTKRLKFCDFVLYEFGAPLICHKLERDAVLKECKVGKEISEGILFEDLEAIHTRGHCLGSTYFLWKGENRNILFSGDTFYPRNGRWSVAIKDGDQDEMIASLKKLLKLNVFYIIPSLFIGDTVYGEFEMVGDYQAVLRNCILMLKNGKTHQAKQKFRLKFQHLKKQLWCINNF